MTYLKILEERPDIARKYQHVEIENKKPMKNDIGWASETICYRRGLPLLWRSNVETDRIGNWLVKLPFRFWLQIKRAPDISNSTRHMMNRND